jgi:hypothetical protein
MYAVIQHGIKHCMYAGMYAVIYHGIYHAMHAAMYNMPILLTPFLCYRRDLHASTLIRSGRN